MLKQRHRADGLRVNMDGPSTNTRKTTQRQRVSRDPAQGPESSPLKIPRTPSRRSIRSRSTEVRRSLREDQREFPRRLFHGLLSRGGHGLPAPHRCREPSREAALRLWRPRPRARNCRTVLLLSGGEKSLTALALLVGIFQFQPSPFCAPRPKWMQPSDETQRCPPRRSFLHTAKQGHAVPARHPLQAHDAGRRHDLRRPPMQEPGVSKIISVRLGSREQHRATSLASPPRVCHNRRKVAPCL